MPHQIWPEVLQKSHTIYCNNITVICIEISRIITAQHNREMPTSWHKYSKYSRGNYLNSEPVLRATSPVTTYTSNALSQKSREAARLMGENKGKQAKRKNMNKKTKTKQKKMCKENENGHIAIQTHTLTTFYERNQLQDQWATLPLNN